LEEILGNIASLVVSEESFLMSTSTKAEAVVNGLIDDCSTISVMTRGSLKDTAATDDDDDNDDSKLWRKLKIDARLFEVNLIGVWTSLATDDDDVDDDVDDDTGRMLRGSSFMDDVDARGTLKTSDSSTI